MVEILNILLENTFYTDTGLDLKYFEIHSLISSLVQNKYVEYIKMLSIKNSIKKKKLKIELQIAIHVHDKTLKNTK